MSSKKLMLAQRASRIGGVGGGVDLAFGGFYRSSLIGAEDGLKLTVSFWIYKADADVTYALSWRAPIFGGRKNAVYVSHTGRVSVELWGRGRHIGSVATSESAPRVPLHTWTHVIVSVDTQSNRALFYIDDHPARTSRVSLAADEYYMGPGPYRVNYDDQGAGSTRCRLAHLYIDQSYVELSSESVRRQFSVYDPERGFVPAAGRESLSPLIYLPCDDPAASGVNMGSGGDFQHNVVAASAVGPGDYSAASVRFTDDQPLTGSLYVAGTRAVLAFGFRADGSAEFIRAGNELQVGYNSGRLYIELRRLGTGSAALVMRVSVSLYIGVMYSIQLSVDMASTDRRHLIINGADMTASAGWDIYVDQAYQVSGAVAVGSQSSVLSGLYFDNRYVDISQFNPFFDSRARRPRYLGEAGELPTGSPPLVYLPLNASDPGANRGTGGDFTGVGTLIGARSPSEFWARSAYFSSGVTSYLKKTGSLGVATKALTAMWVIKDTQGGSIPLLNVYDGEDRKIELYYSPSYPQIRLSAWDESGVERVNVASSSANISYGSFRTVLVSVDLLTQSSHLYIDGIEAKGSATVSSSLVGFLFDKSLTQINRRGASGGSQCSIAGVYLSGEYVDFSAAENRLKFIDAFGYPVDIQPPIDSGDIPKPLIHMKFDDPGALGFNSGSAGDFIINGTVTPGADVGA